MHKKLDSLDPTAESRKEDHIDLAFKSQLGVAGIDNRFYYEPMLASHSDTEYPETKFLGKTFKFPIWISSMTGGNKMAGRINENLARACKDFGLGLGLGSCRQLLTSDDHLKDFDVRSFIGDQALYANLGIAQVETLVQNKEFWKIERLLEKLQADGLIVHVNPLQEWTQPEGDRFLHPPIETIEKLLNALSIKIIVKEVGQGMGKESLSRLMQLPIEAIDFGAYGGTNFAKLELLRNPVKREVHEGLAHIGHSAVEMTKMYNELITELKDKRRCNQVIISGGIKSYLDGYYLINKIQTTAIYGQASPFLKYATENYEKLFQYLEAQIEGLTLTNTYLKIKE